MTMGDVTLHAAPGLGVAVAFTDNNRDRMRFAARSGGYVPETVFSDPDLWVSRGLAHSGGSTTMLLRVNSTFRLATRSQGSWSTTQIRSGVFATNYNMVRCPDGSNHGVFEDNTGPAVDWGLYALDQQGSSYVVQRIGPTLGLNDQPALFCDQDSYVHLAYVQASANGDQLAYGFRAPGQSTYLLDPVPGVTEPHQLSMWVAQDGFDVHLAYISGAENSVRHLHQNSGWTSEVVDPAVVQGFSDTAIGVTPDGVVHVLYTKDGNTQSAVVQYAFGSTGGFQTVALCQQDANCYFGGLAVDGNQAYFLIKDQGTWSMYRR